MVRLNSLKKRNVYKKRSKKYILHGGFSFNIVVNGYFTMKIDNLDGELSVDELKTRIKRILSIPEDYPLVISFTKGGLNRYPLEDGNKLGKYAKTTDPNKVYENAIFIEDLNYEINVPEGMDKIFLHDDHDFRALPTDTVYYYKNRQYEFKLGTYIKHEADWNAGIHGEGPGISEFSIIKMNYALPYGKIYFIAPKPTPGTTVGPEYNFKLYPDRIYYQNNEKGDQIRLGKCIQSEHAYNAGLHGSSEGFSVFENKKFEYYDCRTIQPLSMKVYYLE